MECRYGGGSTFEPCKHMSMTIQTQWVQILSYQSLVSHLLPTSAVSLVKYTVWYQFKSLLLMREQSITLR